MFHKSKLGCFGKGIETDLDGYVPEAGDSPWDFRVDHTERTHEASGELTEYGHWWVEEGFPAWRDEAIVQTQLAIADLARWQEKHA